MKISVKSAVLLLKRTTMNKKSFRKRGRIFLADKEMSEQIFIIDDSCDISYNEQTEGYNGKHTTQERNAVKECGRNAEQDKAATNEPIAPDFFFAPFVIFVHRLMCVKLFCDFIRNGFPAVDVFGDADKDDSGDDPYK